MLCPTVQYAVPQQMSSQDWKITVAQAWGKEVIAVSTAEQEWKDFRSHSEEACRVASQSSGCFRRPPVHRPKGSFPFFVQAFDSRKHPMRQVFASRRIAKFCGRVRDLCRLLALDKDTRTIMTKLVTSWPRAVPRDCPWPRVEEHTRRVLDEYAQAETSRALQAWRVEMAKCGRRATRWLQENHIAPTPSLWIETERGDIPDGKQKVFNGSKLGYVSNCVGGNFKALPE